MKASTTRLRDWARLNKARSFEVIYTTCSVKFPWQVNLENRDTMATVHVDSFERLSRAVDFALKLAGEDEAI